VIRAEHLTKVLSSVRAVDDVSFLIPRGEVVGFLGPNGAGKTTTLRMLAGVFPPSSGRAAIGGHDVVADALEARRHLGYLPERISLYLDMTARSYLEYAAAMKGVARRLRPSAVDIVMEQCGVTTVARRPIGMLSKGYRQRIGLAQALIGDPEALLLDEPTAGLDPEQVAEIRALVRRLAKTRAVLLSSHVLGEVQLTCDRVIILSSGKILAEDAPVALAERFKTMTSITVEAEGPVDPIVRAVSSVVGVRTVHALTGSTGRIVRLRVETEPGRDLRPDLVRAVIDAGFTLLELHADTLSLEDAFLALIGHQTEHA
jgi:ABC-2 type transport system ATP-binding protein